jgi:hypothetical protein
MDERLSGALAAIEVLDRFGTPVRLCSLWAEQPVVLALVRHFG